MDSIKFSIGDTVFHKSDSSVIWVIERIEEDEAYCSTLLKDTKEQKKEKFVLTSLEKCGTPQIRIGKYKSPNRY